MAEHYQLIKLDLEKDSERKVYQTKQTYRVYLKARIVPRWGHYRLREIKAVAVERWLGSIDDLANGTKAKIKSIMSEVFQHAIRYGWLNDGENPIFAVRQSAKRKRVTFRALMLELPQKMRVIGIVAATTGLRISEVLGLKWTDIDWKTLQMDVTRSVVDGIVGKCKTEDLPQARAHRFVHRWRVGGLEERDLLCRAGGLGRCQRASQGQDAALGRYASGSLPATGRKAGRNHKMGRLSYLPAYLLNAAQS